MNSEVFGSCILKLRLIRDSLVYLSTDERQKANYIFLFRNIKIFF